MRKKDIDNFKKLFRNSVLFRYIIYLIVILMLWGLLQIIFPNPNEKTNNIISTNNYVNNIIEPSTN